jgi:hypothetical protein
MKYLILLLLPFSSLADDRHHGNTYVTEITEVTQGQSTALAIASGQHQFDWATDNWQAGVAGGVFKEESALSFGVAKRWDGALLSGSISRTGNDNGYGAAMSWRFK